jgi:hypothetical protein
MMTYPMRKSLQATGEAATDGRVTADNLIGPELTGGKKIHEDE